MLEEATGGSEARVRPETEIFEGRRERKQDQIHWKEPGIKIVADFSTVGEKHLKQISGVTGNHAHVPPVRYSFAHSRVRVLVLVSLSRYCYLSFAFCMLCSFMRVVSRHACSHLLCTFLVLLCLSSFSCDCYLRLFLVLFAILFVLLVLVCVCSAQVISFLCLSSVHLSSVFLRAGSYHFCILMSSCNLF